MIQTKAVTSNSILDVQKRVNADIVILAQAQDWTALRSYFAFWADDDELICKVIAWGRFFLPEYLRDKSPMVHYDLLRKIFTKRNEYTALPRGFGKTTVNQLAICFIVAHELKKFIVVIEKSFTEASEVLNVVREEFTNNEMIRMVYGNLIKADSSGNFDDKNKDAQGDLFVGGVRLRGKGFNAPIRGLKSLAYRPDLVFVDDVEEDTHIKSDEQRLKYKQNYSKGIVPALDVDSYVKVTGTILHFDSLLQNLIDQFDGSIYAAFDTSSPSPEETLLWPERWTYNRLMERKEQMEMEGKGSSAFYQEYCNQPIDDLSRDFKIEWLHHYWSPKDQSLRNKALFRTICIDPAESKKQNADFTAVTVVDTDQDNFWYVRYVKRYRVNSAELIALIFELWQRFKPQVIGIERKAFEDQIKPFMDVKSQETGVFPVVRELEHGGVRKEDRIRGALQGRFEAGRILFEEDATDDTRLLQGEAYDFPFGKNDDLCFRGDTRISTRFGDKAISDIKPGSYVFTPVGLKKVIAISERVSECKNYGWVHATSNHPVFQKSLGFIDIDKLGYQWYNEAVWIKLSTLIQWTVQSVLSFLDGSLSSWEGKESIIFLNQRLIQKESLLKVCTSLFGSLLTERKWRKVIMFITLMVTRLITIQATWSVFRLANMAKNLKTLTSKGLEKILREFALSLLRGTSQRLGFDGTQKMLNAPGKIKSKLNVYVQSVKRFFYHGCLIRSSALPTVGKKSEGYLGSMMKLDHARSALNSSKLINIERTEHALSNVVLSLDTEKAKVYNLEVEDAHCYFANGVLVGNCDSLSYHSQLSKRPYGGATAVVSSLHREFAEMRRLRKKSSSLQARL